MKRVLHGHTIEQTALFSENERVRCVIPARYCLLATEVVVGDVVSFDAEVVEHV